MHPDNAVRKPNFSGEAGVAKLERVATTNVTQSKVVIDFLAHCAYPTFIPSLLSAFVYSLSHALGQPVT